MIKVIITGASGQLGRSLQKLKPRFFDKSNKLFCFNKNEFNLENPKECVRKIKEIKPNWLINCAAYTNVDKAETEPEKALMINGYALNQITKTMKELNCKIIQLSSDFVFDGKESYPYKTSHIRNPINKYGQGKAIGEKIIEDILFPNNNSKIVRTSWLMSSIGKNFAKTILNLHQSKTEIPVITDQVGCFTSADNLAFFLWEILLKEEKGITLPKILHFTNTGICSWFDIAVAIGEFAEKYSIIKNKAKVIPISTKDYDSNAKRPSFSVLDCFESRKLLYKETPYWRDSLEGIIIELSKKSI